MRYFFIEHPKSALLIFLMVTAALALPVSRMRIETDITAYLPRDIEVINTLNEVSQSWATEYYVLLIKSDNVMDSSVMDEIVRLNSLVNPDVNDGGLRDGVVYTMSLASFQSLLPQDVDADFLLSSLPAGITEMLVSKDRTQTAILVGVYPFANRTALTQRIKSVAVSSPLSVSVTGLPIISEEVMGWANSRMYIMLMVLVILLCIIYAFHRTVKSIIICLLPSMLAMLQTYGILVLSGLTLTTEVVLLVAPMTLALGVNYAIYIMERFSSTNGSEIKDRLYTTTNTTGKAVFLSALTTFVGFFALGYGILPSVRVLGIALMLAIALTFISTIIVVPALIKILRFEKKRRESAWHGVSRWPIRHAKLIVPVILVLTVVSIFTVRTVSTSVDYMEMMPETIPSINTMMEYSKNMGSSAQPNMVLVKGNITDVRALNGLNALIDRLNGVQNVTAFGMPTIYGTMWRMLPLFPELYGPFPSEQWQINIIDHLLTSFAGKEMLSTFISGNSSMIMVNTPTLGIDDATRVVREVNEVLGYAQIPGCTVSNLTGSLAITVEINDLLIGSQTSTLIISLVLIFLVTVFIFRSLRLGGLAFLPAVLVVAWEPLLLFILKIPLSLITISLGSIMMGLGIDYGIEIVQRANDEGMGIEGMEASVDHTGVALTEAVSTEIFGLAPALLIEITPVRQFILLLMLLIFVAYIFATFFLPALYSLLVREHGRV